MIHDYNKLHILVGKEVYYYQKECIRSCKGVAMFHNLLDNFRILSDEKSLFVYEIS